MPKLKYEKIVGYNTAGQDLHWREGEMERWGERETGCHRFGFAELNPINWVSVAIGARDIISVKK